jgi:hypothetical protein
MSWRWRDWLRCGSERKRLSFHSANRERRPAPTRRQNLADLRDNCRTICAVRSDAQTVLGKLAACDKCCNQALSLIGAQEPPQSRQRVIRRYLNSYLLGPTDESLFSSRLIEERTALRFLPAVIHRGSRENIDQCLLPVRSRKPGSRYARSLLRCSPLYAHSVSPQQDTCSQRGSPTTGSIGEPNRCCVHCIRIFVTFAQDGQATEAHFVALLFSLRRCISFLSHLNPQSGQRPFATPVIGPNHSPSLAISSKEQHKQLIRA